VKPCKEKSAVKNKMVSDRTLIFKKIVNSNT